MSFRSGGMDRPRGGGGGDFGAREPPDISHLFSLMVFNISYQTRKEELSRTFDRFGEIADVFIPRDRQGEPRGFAFVRFYNKRDAEDAKSLDGRMVDGRRIGVQTAKYGRRSERGGGGGGFDRGGGGRMAERDRDYDRRGGGGYGGARGGGGGYGGGYRDRDRDRDRRGDRRCVECVANWRRWSTD